MANIFTKWFDTDSIDSNVNTQNVGYVIERIKKNLICLTPEYQRDEKVGKWSEELAKKAIISLLRNWGIGEFKFASRIGDSKLFVIDGKQRLTSIKRFMEGNFSIMVNGVKTYFVEPQKAPNCKYNVFTDEEIAAFEQIEFSVRTYKQVTLEDERAIFAAVQNGVRLSPGEVIRATGNDLSNFAAELADTHIEELDELYGGKNSASTFNVRGGAVHFCLQIIVSVITNGYIVYRVNSFSKLLAAKHDKRLTEEVKKIAEKRLDNIIKYDNQLNKFFFDDDGKSIRRRCQKTFGMMLIAIDELESNNVNEKYWGEVCKSLIIKRWLSPNAKKQTDGRRLKAEDIWEDVRNEIYQLTGKDITKRYNDDIVNEEETDNEDEEEELQPKNKKRHL